MSILFIGVFITFLLQFYYILVNLYITYLYYIFIILYCHFIVKDFLMIYLIIFFYFCYYLYFHKMVRSPIRGSALKCHLFLQLDVHNDPRSCLFEHFLDSNVKLRNRLTPACQVVIRAPCRVRTSSAHELRGSLVHDNFLYITQVCPYAIHSATCVFHAVALWNRRAYHIRKKFAVESDICPCHCYRKIPILHQIFDKCSKEHIIIGVFTYPAIQFGHKVYCFFLQRFRGNPQHRFQFSHIDDISILIKRRINRRPSKILCSSFDLVRQALLKEKLVLRVWVKLHKGVLKRKLTCSHYRKFLLKCQFIP